MNEPALWRGIITATGVAGVGAFVFWSLYKQWLSLPIFDKLTQRQTFALMVMFLGLTFTAAMTLIVMYAFQHRPETKGPAIAMAAPSMARTVSLDITGTGTVFLREADGTLTRPCSRTCQMVLHKPWPIALRAVADSGFAFAGWRGACSGPRDCPINSESDIQVEAVFERNVRLSVNVGKKGNGRVAIASDQTQPSLSGSAKCLTDCEYSVARGAKVTLSPIPVGDAIFTGWKGAGCSGRGECVLFAWDDAEVVAQFRPKCLTTFRFWSSDAGLRASKVCDCVGKAPKSTGFVLVKASERFGHVDYLRAQTSGLALPEGWECER